MSTSQQIKVIRANGQVSLGKKFAGQIVMVDQRNDGIWIIKVVKFFSKSEKWLHQGGNLRKLEKALDWAENNKSIDNFAQFY
jgi:hypothetical protein